MFKHLGEIAAKRAHRVIGLMSGTSLDGVDAALCELSGAGRGGLVVKLIATHVEPYPDALRERVLRACDPKGATTAEICELNFLVGEVFASSATGVLRAARTKSLDVDLIGSHGQTIAHYPPRDGGRYGSTLQIGEASVIAERCGIPVVSNFRARDMAAGGQGAPLVPFVDYLLFSSAEKSRVSLNIGGISNVTWLPKNGVLEDVLAYDTGPGNMVIDAMVQRMTDGESFYDKDGEIAASGNVHPGLMNEMLAHGYLLRPPPKSTGREEFGAAYADEKFERGLELGLSPEDIVATATAMTAVSIAGSLKRFIETKGPIDEILVAGGGALNPTLMRRLARQLPGVDVKSSDAYGIPSKAKECIAFAILARETLLGRAGNLPAATGASGPRVLGQVTPA